MWACLATTAMTTVPFRHSQLLNNNNKGPNGTISMCSHCADGELFALHLATDCG